MPDVERAIEALERFSRHHGLVVFENGVHGPDTGPAVLHYRPLDPVGAFERRLGRSIHEVLAALRGCADGTDARGGEPCPR